MATTMKQEMKTIVMTKSELPVQLGGKFVGSLMFPAEYYNLLHHIDLKKLRNLHKSKISKGARILKVLVMTDNHPDFEKYLNTEIPLKYSIFATQGEEGAYKKNALEVCLCGLEIIHWVMLLSLPMNAINLEYSFYFYLHNSFPNFKKLK
jgi:hypothetical protein